MSEAARLANEEADRTEAEPDENEQGEAEEVEGQPAEPDTEPGTEPDVTPPAEPAPDVPQGTSEAEFEKAMRALEKEATRHANRVSEIMGENGQALEPCPLCWTPGFVYPPEVPWLDPLRIAAVKVAIGEAVEPEYKDAQDKQTCDECDGLTKTKTGAKIGEQVALPCRKCMGQGWIQKLSVATTQEGNGATVAAPAFTPQPGIEDKWGRPAGHPHWGIAPASVGV